MTLVQLQYFQVLAHTLHFTKSAEKLCISQPSLSYAMNELEKELGVALIRREKKSVQLTEHGKAFLPYVEETLRVLHEGCDFVRKMDGDVAHVIRMGYFHSVSASVVPKLVEGFLHDPMNRKIRIQFTEDSVENILKQLADGQLDCVLSPEVFDTTADIPIMKQEVYLAVSVDHPLAARESVEFSDFMYEPQIMLSPSSKLRTKIDELFREANVEPNIIFEVRECNAALQYVGMNFGVAMLPEVPVMNSGKVKAIRVTGESGDLSRMIYFLTNKKHVTMETQLFRDYVENHFRFSEEEGQ